MDATQMKVIRKELGLTQTDIGKLVYLTDRHIRNIEAGRSPLPPLVAEKLLRLAANFRA